jgi:hypothetical protein
MSEVDRYCLVTNNPCGTDTRPVGVPCMCKECQTWLKEHMIDLDPEIERVINEHFWSLI